MKTFTPISLALFIATTAAVATDEIKPSPPTAVLVRQLLDQCDRSEAELRSASALASCISALKLEPGNAEALVRAARQYRHLMESATSNSDKLRLGTKALDCAQQAATAAPANSDAQLSPAITMGKMLPLLGKSEQVKYSPQIKAAAEKATALNPNNDLAWHILGRWHRVVSQVGGVKRFVGNIFYGSLPDGSLDDAKNYLTHAIKINPTRMIHYVELGRVLIARGDKSEAEKALTKAASLPVIEWDDKQAKVDAAALLKELKGG